MSDFMLRAFVAGIGIAIMAAPFGCFMVWRRIAFFGAAISHAALLGIAIGILLGTNLFAGIFAAALVTALILAWGGPAASVTSDAMLGIVSHAALAAGLVVLAFMEGTRVDLMAYLFGDILAISWRDIAIMAGIAVPVLVVLAAIWRPLLLMTVDEDLAAVDGIRTRIVKTVFMLLLAAAIAVAIRLVGLLLVTALLIMPAVSARNFTRTPEGMAGVAAILGAVAVGAGLFAAMRLDTPAGPTIVVAATALLFVAWTSSAMRHQT